MGDHSGRLARGGRRHRVLLACPPNGGRLRVITTVQDSLAAQAILANGAGAGATVPPGPAPPAPAAIT